MSPESENFEKLTRLLALKRHEVPPPGYFNNFSRDVIGRIRAENAAAVASSPSWLQRLWTALEVKPAFAGAFGLGVCALLIVGVIYSAKMEEQPMASANLANAPSFAALGGGNSAAMPFTQTGNSSAINPLIGTPQQGSLFDQFPIQVQPASFHPVGN